MKFRPDLSNLTFFEFLPPDFRDDPKTSRYFEKIDLSDADLSNADLSSLNFARADFTGSNLSNANMSKSNFNNAKFYETNLSNASLEKSHFVAAVFERTQLDDAFIEGTNFKDAAIVDGEMTDSVKERLKYMGAEFYERQDYITKFTISEAVPKLHPDRKKAESDKRTLKQGYDVFFGTNRDPRFQRGALVDFGSDISRELSFGVCEVTVPAGRRVGSLGSPMWRRLLNRYDDRLKLSRLISLDQQLFWSFINQSAAEMNVRARPTIFVHGFNNTFENAVLRAAQIGYDLGIGQGVGLFSWPSRGSLSNYSGDEASAEASKYALADFLEQFVLNTNQGGVNIIAHSMGCRLALNAFEVLSSDRKNILRSINQVILAAADVDTNIMPRLGMSCVNHVKRTTSYVSSKDRALALSGWLHNYPRVGITPPTFVLEKMDTIIANDGASTGICHDYVGSNRSILKDIFDLLKSNCAPENRFAVKKVLSGSKVYWQIRD